MAIPLTDPASLDADRIKQSLIAFLKTQSEFSDYNFAGSGLNVLIDILVANTHYYALYKAMIANESFLDSAILRSSIISRANERGYLPRGIIVARSTVTATLSNSTVGQLSMEIPKGSTFVGNYGNAQFYFSNTDSAALLPTGISGQYSGTFVVAEGYETTTTFDVAPGSRYILPNLGVDPSTIRVRVETSRFNTNGEVFVNLSSLITTDSLSPAYILTEDESGKYEIIFGNGVFGKPVSNGNVVIVSYHVSTPGAGNGIATLSPTTQLFQVGDLTLTNTVTSGAELGETLLSIKENVKRHIPQQNRCVVESDYETEIKKQFPQFKDVVAWGGEKNVPPVLGKTFISVLTSDMMPLTRQMKSTVITAIKRKNITAITPEIVDALPTSIRVAATLKVNLALSNSTVQDIYSLVKTVISNYDVAYLNKFKSKFVESQLVTKIVECSPSVISAKLKVLLVSKIYPNLVKPTSYSMSFNAPIAPGSLTCDSFTIQNPTVATDYKFVDAAGVVKIIAIPNNGATTYFLNGNYGSINYTTGEVQISEVIISPSANSVGLSVFATPADQDIFSTGLHVLSIDTTNTVVTSQQITS